MPNKSNRKSILAGAGIVIIAISFFLFLSFSRTSPGQRPSNSTIQTVDVLQVKQMDLPVIVQAVGTVVPAKSVRVIPQVSGKVIEISEKFIPGGFVKKGDVLVRVEPTEYDLAVREAKATVSLAELNLKEQESARAVADRELKLVGNDLSLTDQGMELANRKLYVKNAHDQLDAAKSRLEYAELERQRTLIRAPFDAWVREKLVDVGQVVSPQEAVASLVASDVVWVEATLPIDNIRWIEFPSTTNKKGSPVTLHQKLRGKEEIARMGNVLRLLPDLDEKGSLTRILIEVPDPFNNSSKDSGKDSFSDGSSLPLLIGSFVRIDIEGAVIPGLIRIPRNALREDSQVWVIRKDSHLEFRKVEAVWSDEKAIYLKGDLKEGESVIISRLNNPIPGMSLSVNEKSSNFRSVPPGDTEKSTSSTNQPESGNP